MMKRAMNEQECLNEDAFENEPQHKHHIPTIKEEEKHLIDKMEKSKRFSYFLLGISILSEVIATLSLKLSMGFTVVVPSIVTVITYLISFSLLVIILEKMPLGLVYGIWGGVGSALTMIAGVLIWNDPFTPLMAVGLVLVVVGVYYLNSGTDQIEAQRAQEERAKNEA
ncbi:MAG: DMT family transporter [Eggerthellaceae bacterium]